MEQFFFYIFAIMSVGGALACVTRKNPLNSAIALIVTFLGLSGLYFLSRAPFVGILQILVYAGAIMVLVLFVIMFLNLPETELEEEKISKPGLFLSLFLLMPLFALCLGVLLEVRDTDGAVASGEEDFGTLEAVGARMFEKYVFQFEAVSILLLVAIVGAVMLAKKRI